MNIQTKAPHAPDAEKPAAEIDIRAATPNDADAMAKLINLAGEGFPVYLWESMIEGDETVWDVGRRRAQREEGGFSYRNTYVAVGEDQIMGAITAYAQPDTIDPVDPAVTPAMFVPILELEGLAPGSWYINVLAVFPPFRNLGLGSVLVRAAEQHARDAGKRTVSIIASDGNPGAVRLYERLGYQVRATRTMIKDGWDNPGKNWILLTKEV